MRHARSRPFLRANLEDDNEAAHAVQAAREEPLTVCGEPGSEWDYPRDLLVKPGSGKGGGGKSGNLFRRVNDLCPACRAILQSTIGKQGRKVRVTEDA